MDSNKEKRESKTTSQILMSEMIARLLEDQSNVYRVQRDGNAVTVEMTDLTTFEIKVKCTLH